jgi:hypothetical protein
MTTPMSANLNEAIRLLGIYSAGRFDIWALAGSSRASARSHVMSTLVGSKVPQSKAGVNAIRSAFYSALEIHGEHEAARESAFVRVCKIQPPAV